MDHYSVLGVTKQSSDKEIKTAFRKLAAKHHPDKGGDHQEFIKIKEAYETLSDPAKRQQYDNPQPQGFGGNGYQNGFNFQDMNPDMQDIFGQMFRNGTDPFRAPPRRNKDITIAAKITLEDIITGKNMLASYRLRSGNKETVDIHVPPGMRTDDVIRYQGLGDDALNFARGDLHVKIQILKHDHWHKEGQHVYREYLVNALDLIVGTSIIVHTLDGKKLDLKIPPGTQSGGRFNIAQHGLPDRGSNIRGNAYIIVNADIPKITNEGVLDYVKSIKKIIESDNETT